MDITNETLNEIEEDFGSHVVEAFMEQINAAYDAFYGFEDFLNVYVQTHKNFFCAPIEYISLSVH